MMIKPDIPISRKTMRQTNTHTDLTGCSLVLKIFK